LDKDLLVLQGVPLFRPDPLELKPEDQATDGADSLLSFHGVVQRPLHLILKQSLPRIKNKEMRVIFSLTDSLGDPIQQGKQEGLGFASASGSNQHDPGVPAIQAFQDLSPGGDLKVRIALVPPHVADSAKPRILSLLRPVRIPHGGIAGTDLRSEAGDQIPPGVIPFEPLAKPPEDPPSLDRKGGMDLRSNLDPKQIAGKGGEVEKKGSVSEIRDVRPVGGVQMIQGFLDLFHVFLYRAHFHPPVYLLG
jgi:hypothetical protein